MEGLLTIIGDWKILPANQTKSLRESLERLKIDFTVKKRTDVRERGVMSQGKWY